MGQYWLVVNIEKREFVDPHKLGAGLKLWEQLANHPGTGAALIVIMAAMPEARGGGDFDLEVNWHGPERTFPEHNTSPGPMPEGYYAVAKRTIGRWAGDRVALIGDYAEQDDLPQSEIPAPQMYHLCCGREYFDRHRDEFGSISPDDLFTDISDDVCRVIEHELGGKFSGDGWRDWKPNKDSGPSIEFEIEETEQ